MIEVKFDGNGVQVKVAGSGSDLHLEIVALLHSLISEEKTCELLIDALEEVMSEND